MKTALNAIRKKIRNHTLPDESLVLKNLMKETSLNASLRAQITEKAIVLINKIRASTSPGLMESFLAEYGLSTDEGIALMTLAEALLRVPDDETIDALIEDKIAPSDWGKHLGKSSSSLVNASTWALMLTGKVLDDDDEGLLGSLRGAVKRLGEPVIRTAVGQAMKEMGRQFVLGRDIEEAMKTAKSREKQGYTYSYDMLGEAARTEADAKRYHLAYADAINHLAKDCTKADIRNNPGISVKLSALHPRYEMSQKTRVMNELVPRARSLALLAKSAGMGFNIDAEEADRLDLSLDVIEAMLSEPSLAGWNGFGVVVQAYGPRASFVLDWLYELATKLDRKIMVRLVKGAYWDTEIKRAQTLGLSGYPVFTRKTSTDVSYITNAAKLLSMTDRIYPQFATHNAHTVAAILEIAGTYKETFEFQRLHGMGESLHDVVLAEEGTRCRIYAPVGAHHDLLAYLVRRLLENGANSSFVNQIVDEEIPAEEIAHDPFKSVESYLDDVRNPGIHLPKDIYGENRLNSTGFDFTDATDIQAIEKGREPFKTHVWQVKPLIAGKSSPLKAEQAFSPSNPSDLIGKISLASDADVETALAKAKPWDTISADERAAILNKAADLYEQNAHEYFAMLAREAGKTWLDSINELREAVDFLRYYANEARQHTGFIPQGVFTCISPWNFPLAIFTGQISAALAAGNAVLAKPAETTPIIAHKAVQLLHEAGVPVEALQFLPGEGSRIGSAITVSSEISGCCFTGSTRTAQLINRSMSQSCKVDAPLIAETGGLNAMIVDSTALPEQAVRDILASAFQSAGQRCSALRCLYVQSDIADRILTMLSGAMDELSLGNPWELSTDIGPVIDETARNKIQTHIDQAKAQGKLIKQLETPTEGIFVAPAMLEVSSILEMKEEIFGPVLHVVKYEADEIDKVIADINATGYGLTFGLHTRIDDRVEHVVNSIKAGNIYVNRNQIGAVVGSQPFGGEGMSGTGPKAGGPHYLKRFIKPETEKLAKNSQKPSSPLNQGMLERAIEKARADFHQQRINEHSLPGPTGESNRLSEFGRGVISCLGPSKEDYDMQIELAKAAGCSPVLLDDAILHDGLDLAEIDFTVLAQTDAIMYFETDAIARKLKQEISMSDGPIVPILFSRHDATILTSERHVCIDTTASGGNTSLLAAQS